MTGGLGIPRSDYHSAHKAPVVAPAQVDYVGESVRAHRLDLMDTDPEWLIAGPFADCDVLVADLPWQRGFETFNDRACVTDGRTYPGFMHAVSGLVEAATVPTYLITGAHALRFLPKADVVLPMRLNEDEAIAVGYRPGIEAFGEGYPIAQEFLRALADTYDCAGDFCCGYGRTGRFFARAGKRAVLSDVNAQCIGYIAEHAEEWAP